MRVLEGSTVTATVGHVPGHGKLEIRAILRDRYGDIVLEYRMGDSGWKRRFRDVLPQLGPTDG